MKQDLLSKFIKAFSIDTRVIVCNCIIDENGEQLTVMGEIHNEEYKSKLLEFLQPHCKSIDDQLEIVFSNTEKKPQGLINVSVANLHKTPKLSSPLVTQALLGTQVTIIKDNNEWLLVQLPDGYLGWISEMLHRVPDGSFSLVDSSKKIIITDLHAYVFRSQTKEEIISDAVIGDVFFLQETVDHFYVVKYPDRRIGYLEQEKGSLFQNWLKNIKCTHESIVDTARKFTGIPYLWGGVSSKAVDCSGFVKLVYFLNGIMLPRDADQQAKVGIEIYRNDNMSNVLPGDLLFFARRNEITGEIPITHVGLSLGGMEYMQASGDVHLSSFNPDHPYFDKRRSESLVKIKRIIGAGENEWGAPVQLV